MSRTHLRGLTAMNPLGFLAALGVQVALESESRRTWLWWSDDVVSHAVIESNLDVETIAAAAVARCRELAQSRAVRPGLEPDGDVKFGEATLREYLANASAGQGASLAQALVAEGSYDGKRAAKPTDLYFTAGRQLFLRMTTEILEGVADEHVAIAVRGPWPYDSSLPSLMWDVVDDRIYALSAANPADDPKSTNPGAEALAILGLERYPVFATSSRTATTGCVGSWKGAAFTWPIWCIPALPGGVRSLVQQVDPSRTAYLAGWGVKALMRSRIRRSDQGGYGTFSPAEVVWTRPD